MHPCPANWSLSDAQEDEDENTLERIEYAEEELHRNRSSIDGEESKDPSQTCEHVTESTISKITHPCGVEASARA